MASKPKHKMPISERAKQFMPFSALKGLEEAIRAKEHPLEERKAPNDEQIADINDKLHMLSPHDNVRVVFYFMGRYYLTEGEIEKFDTATRTLEIASVEILFDEIVELDIKEKKL